MAALYHPFVLALGAGSLPRRRFVRYSLQDAFFLSAFADSYGAAASLLDGGEEDGEGVQEGEGELSVRAVLQRLQGEADGELVMHAGTVKAWVEESRDPSRARTDQDAGVTADVTTDSAPLPATLEYTAFLAHIVRGERGVWDGMGLGEERGEKDKKSHPYDHVNGFRPSEDRVSPGARRWHALCVLAAMLPCMRLYAFIGQTLGGAVWGMRGVVGAARGGGGECGSSEVCFKGGTSLSEGDWQWHPYGQWLHTYSCQGFEAAASLLESAFDRLWSRHLLSLQHSCSSQSASQQHLSEQQRQAEQHLSQVYGRAMQLEFDFFHAQLAPFPTAPPLPHAPLSVLSVPVWPGFFALASHGQATVRREASEAGGSSRAGARRVVLAVDFDGTCTVDDSSALLACLALAQAGSSAGAQQVWDDLVQRYVQDHSGFMASNLPPHPPAAAHRDSSSSSSSSSSKTRDQRSDSNTSSSRRSSATTTTSATPDLPPGLLPFLHRLSSFEAMANQRVTAVAALQGIPQHALLAAAREAADVAEGKGEAVRHAMLMEEGEWGERGKQGEAEGVGEKTCSGVGEEGGAGENSMVVVRANEMEFDAHGVSTGAVDFHVQGPMDKDTIFHALTHGKLTHGGPEHETAGAATPAAPCAPLWPSAHPALSLAIAPRTCCPCCERRWAW
ncbi:hypothetical protein CLOP_g14812 [Closterium sp. NIES-67]|nr:hypothetical protein CLOP_g14812 [Closterium sp. NIES-67]